MRIGRGVKR
ncbi:hypothetical protein YPPY94_0334, partial [Yersinia pestis PY-94]